MHGLMENAIYGGRVDNTFDVLVLRSYLHQIFNNANISGEAASRSRGLPCGKIPVSTRIKVSELEWWLVAD